MPDESSQKFREPSKVLKSKSFGQDTPEKKTDKDYYESLDVFSE